MSFVIRGLSPEPFRPLFALDDATLAARNIRRVVADSDRGFPCRVTLQDARLGETLLLLPYLHHDVAGPYRASGPIYVREAAMRGPAFEQGAGLPDSFLHRLLSLRAYGADGLMVAADVIAGGEAEVEIERLFALPQVTYLHLHNARPGCYAAEARRCPD